ncbi:hypothetical protein ACIA8E_33050 [Streptomyces sp. NPDC051664]|uniref:hypothetical protein n=1 Tax=Streptomyces sp. NPDC051664 TaxID=3365668 RepID=UPI0037BBA6D2
MTQVFAKMAEAEKKQAIQVLDGPAHLGRAEDEGHNACADRGQHHSLPLEGAVTLASRAG